MRLCDVEGCGRKHYAKGLCNPHYQGLRKHGDLETRVREKYGPENWNWVGDAAGYERAHVRLRKRQGPARAHTCACGAPAAEWSYDHLDPAEVVGEYRGKVRAYSLDDSHYQARCIPCHRRFDLASPFQR